MATIMVLTAAVQGSRSVSQGSTAADAMTVLGANLGVGASKPCERRSRNEGEG